MARRIEVPHALTLDDYEAVAHLAPTVRELRVEASLMAPRLRGRTVWMVNSTESGGGVAEMLPHVVTLLRDLDVAAEWAVIETDRADFFAVTKRLHNLIHGVGSPDLAAEDRAAFEAVNRENAAELLRWLKPRDILVVHDPQPMPLAALLRAEMPSLRTVWRCHIGLDEQLPQTRSAWEFLEPYAAAYDHAVFSATEYIPPYFSTRASLIYPAIDPLNDKNRHLPLHKLVGVLVNSALTTNPGPVLTPTYPRVAQRLQPSGEFAPANMSEDIGLITRPIVTQISRWDRLKGFAPLIRAFAELKAKLYDGRANGRGTFHRRRLELARLVLAGPDPDSVADDPEGLDVLDELKSLYTSLPEDAQRDIALLALPMRDRAQNAIMVNALQRASSVVVQNSLREGFGLTVTEAMWKGIPVLSNSRACGPRQQLRDGLDGRLIENPEDGSELARTIDEMLAEPKLRQTWGGAAQRRAHDHFLLFGQLRGWLGVLTGVAAG